MTVPSSLCKVKPKPIEFDLLGNAKDSFPQAVDMLVNDDVSSHHARLKQAILSAAHCIELLLKERLRQIHPAFVWETSIRFRISMHESSVPAQHCNASEWDS